MKIVRPREDDFVDFTFRDFQMREICRRRGCRDDDKTVKRSATDLNRSRDE